MPINETLSVKKAAATNRTVIKEFSECMGGSFTSEVIDFSDMPIGCLQAVWENVDGYEGEAKGYFLIKASCFRDPATFDYVRGSTEEITTAHGARMWNLGVIGYRYAMVVYDAGANTSGQCIIVASAKKT